MICKSFAVVGALTLLSAVADAASAPKEVYGKSISVGWSQTLSERFATEGVTRNSGQVVQMNIYISTAGRPFVRVFQTVIGGGSRHQSGGTSPIKGATSEAAPGASAAKDRVTFEGRSVVVYRELQSGARRVVIDVDGAGTGCKASVVHGREGGKTMARNARGAGMSEIFSIQVGAVNCSIREGNVFGQ
jgi:hypothetical protein